MKKTKTISLFVAVFLALSLCAPGYTAAAAAVSVPATPTAVSLNVDGNPLKLNAYIINGNHYFKLRDLAKAVSGTKKQFDVVWDAETSSVNLISGKAYTESSEGTSVPQTSQQSAEPSALQITLDGFSTDYMAYVIDSSHYFKLRDIMSAFDIGVSWDQASHCISLNTGAPYETDTYTAPSSQTNQTALLTTENIAAKSSSVVMINAYDDTGKEIGQGSGFFLTADGWIVTCFHVIDGASKVTVTTDNGKTYLVGSVLAYNVGKDTALIKANAITHATYLKLGDSSTLQRGQSIVVIGSPFGLENTISSGLISSFRSDVGLRDKGTTDIQISAPISSGSSGGPMFNMYGEVVGLIYATHLVGQNLNFAIPVNDAKALLSSISPISLSTMLERVAAQRAAEKAEETEPSSLKQDAPSALQYIS